MRNIFGWSRGFPNPKYASDSNLSLGFWFWLCHRRSFSTTRLPVQHEQAGNGRFCGSDPDVYVSRLFGLAEWTLSNVWLCLGSRRHLLRHGSIVLFDGHSFHKPYGKYEEHSFPQKRQINERKYKSKQFDYAGIGPIASVTTLSKYTERYLCISLVHLSRKSKKKKQP